MCAYGIQCLLLPRVSCFHIFITDYQHIIISQSLLTNNILISFDHLFCNLNHIAFLIILHHNVSKFLLYILDVKQSFQCFFGFQILLFTGVSLFLLLPQCTFLINTLTNTTILPPYFSMSSWSPFASTIPVQPLVKLL